LRKQPVQPAHGRKIVKAFSPDGQCVVTASWDQTVIVWDAETNKPIGSPLQHQGRVFSAAFSPDGRRLLSAADDKAVRVWDSDDGKPRPTILQQQDIDSAAFSPDGSRILTTSSSSNRPRDASTATIWDAETGKRIHSIEHTGRKPWAVFTPDGRYIVAVFEHEVDELDAFTGLVQSQLRHEDPISSAFLSQDGRRAVITYGDKPAQVWDFNTGKVIGSPFPKLGGFEGGLDFAAFAPDGRRVLATFSFTDPYERATGHTFWALIRDIVTGKDVDLPTDELPVDTAAFSPDARQVVIGVSTSARVFDAYTAKPVGVPMEHRSRLMSAAFSSDGKLVVTASEDWTARVWDAVTGRPVSSLLQHQDSVESAAFSMDGRRVATASSDKTARVWDAYTGNPIGSPLQHQSTVYSATFSPEGRRLLTVSADKTAKVWTILPDSGVSHDEVALLAKFVEALGGYRVNEFESTVPIANQFERMEDLRRILTKRSNQPGELTSFLRRLLSAP
jgi:WD40 repeat protein